MNHAPTLSNAQRKNIRVRSKMIYSIETYFHTMNYVAVHTPTRSDWLIPERHIPVCAAQESPKKYLLPSPELHLKQLLAMWDSPRPPNIYEFSHSFRNENTRDRVHNDEFLMLEWYTMNATLADSISICTGILETVVDTLNSAQCEQHPIWTSNLRRSLVQSMADSFQAYTPFSLEKLVTCTSALDAAEYSGLLSTNNKEAIRTYEWDDIFHMLLVNLIEPKLPRDRPVFLTYYPARVPTLAASCTDNPMWAERWELYIHGIEIANGYVEETDPHVIAAFMRNEQEKIATRNHARSESVPCDTSFLTRRTLPPCAGVAMGIDRLMLALLYDESTATTGLQDVSPLSIFQ